MVTQPWLRLKRLIKDLSDQGLIKDLSDQGFYREPGIDVFWDGDGLTIKVCRDPSHISWKPHAHRGLWSKWISSDEQSGEAVVSQE
jgi:hypothetical protein